MKNTEKFNILKVAYCTSVMTTPSPYPPQRLKSNWENCFGLPFHFRVIFESFYTDLNSF